MFERFSRPAREVVTGAVAEAQRRGDRRVGTEHLLLGVLRQPWAPAAEALGVDLAAGRAALDALDRAALASVGVEVPEAATSADAPVPLKGRLPFTAAARATLARSLHIAVSQGSRTLHTEHLLMSLLDGSPADPACALLARLGVDPAEVRARLRPAA
jgi:ATP-dependent Clp protease ATP-binding subunit ClpA